MITLKWKWSCNKLTAFYLLLTACKEGGIVFYILKNSEICPAGTRFDTKHLKKCYSRKRFLTVDCFYVVQIVKIR